MELSQLLITGSLGGLVSVLAHSVLWSVIEWLHPPRHGSSATEVPTAEVVIHMLGGIGLALLFWLSWGLAAIIDPRWYVRGAVFAGVSLTLCLPSIIGTAIVRATPAGAIVIIAARWTTTCLVVGLACAWNWDQGF